MALEVARRGAAGGSRDPRTRSRLVGAVTSHGSAGAAALEFALVATLVLIPLVLGTIELGFVFNAKLAVTHAAREGARMAAVRPESEWPGLVVPIQDRAKPGVTNAVATIVSDTSGSDPAVKVTVTAPWTWKVVPLGGGLTLTSEAIMRIE